MSAKADPYPWGTPRHFADVHVADFKIVAKRINISLSGLEKPSVVHPLQTNTHQSNELHVQKVVAQLKVSADIERKCSASEPRQMPAVPSPAESLAGIHQRWRGPGENNPFSPYDGWQSPNTPILEINLWFTQGLKQHHCAQERKWSILPLTPNKK